MNSKEIIKNIEEKIMNNEFKTKEELNQHLTDLKDRGILTKAQVNSNAQELSKLYDSLNKKTEVSRMATRTPQRQDYANASAGFSNMNFLVLSLLTLTLAVAMINLLNR